MIKIVTYTSIIALMGALMLPASSSAQGGFDANQAARDAANSIIENDHQAFSRYPNPSVAENWHERLRVITEGIVKNSPVVPGVETDRGIEPGITIRQPF